MPFPYSSNDLRRTVSTLDVNSVNCFYPIRESQSFTNGSRTIYHKQYQDEKSEEEEKPGNNSNFICTRQMYSEEPFYVYEQMLKYRGEKYSEKDIAPIWKKDCRMWLWKTNNRKTANKVA